MEMISKNFNKISKGASSLILVFLFLIAIVLLLTNMPNIFAQSQYGGYEMNASIQQVISITLSGNLTTGIFFTNTTTIGIQYPITNMTVWNNATANYWGSSYGTEYYVNVSGLTNIKVCHCACSDLKCNNQRTPECSGFSMPLNGTGTDEGVKWINDTTSNPGNNPTYLLQNLTYQVVAGSLASGNAIYLRYWLDPYPNNTPSGSYNTTYIFKGVDYVQTCGACTC